MSIFEKFRSSEAKLRHEIERQETVSRELSKKELARQNRAQLDERRETSYKEWQEGSEVKKLESLRSALEEYSEECKKMGHAFAHLAELLVQAAKGMDRYFDVYSKGVNLVWQLGQNIQAAREYSRKPTEPEIVADRISTAEAIVGYILEIEEYGRTGKLPDRQEKMFGEIDAMKMPGWDRGVFLEEEMKGSLERGDLASVEEVLKDYLDDYKRQQVPQEAGKLSLAAAAADAGRLMLADEGGKLSLAEDGDEEKKEE